jgi:hypothetical protein
LFAIFFLRLIVIATMGILHDANGGYGDDDGGRGSPAQRGPS